MARRSTCGGRSVPCRRRPCEGPMAEESTARRVLLVEDNPDDRLRIQRMVRGHRRDYRIEQCTSGEEALSLLARDSAFDCVILDYRLPDMDGLEFLRRLRGGGRLP